MHILSPETDNCPSWISGRERMTVENISWSISTEECCRPRRGLNQRPPGLQLNAHPTEPLRPAHTNNQNICHWSFFLVTIESYHSCVMWKPAFQQLTYWNISLIFPRKQVLTFYSNRLPKRQYAWNVKAFFYGKNKKNFPNVVCWNFYSVCSVKLFSYCFFLLFVVFHCCCFFFFFFC